MELVEKINNIDDIDNFTEVLGKYKTVIMKSSRYKRMLAGSLISKIIDGNDGMYNMLHKIIKQDPGMVQSIVLASESSSEKLRENLCLDRVFRLKNKDIYEAIRLVFSYLPETGEFKDLIKEFENKTHLRVEHKKVEEDDPFMAMVNEMDGGVKVKEEPVKDESDSIELLDESSSDSSTDDSGSSSSEVIPPPFGLDSESESESDSIPEEIVADAPEKADPVDESESSDSDMDEDAMDETGSYKVIPRYSERGPRIFIIIDSNLSSDENVQFKNYVHMLDGEAREQNRPEDGIRWYGLDSMHKLTYLIAFNTNRLLTYIGHEDRIRVLTNSRRENDFIRKMPGEASAANAAQQVIRVIRNTLRLTSVEILVYYYRNTEAKKLHDPKGKVYVTNNDDVAMAFVTFNDFRRYFH